MAMYWVSYSCVLKYKIDNIFKVFSVFIAGGSEQLYYKQTD